MFKRIFENSPHPCFVFDESGVISDINKSAIPFLKKWNLSIDSLSSKNLNICLNQIRLGLKNLEILIEENFFRFDITEFSLGKFCFHAYDITHQKNTADTLFNLVDDINEGLVLVDVENDGLVVEVNKSVLSFLGYEREEIYSLKLKDIISDFKLLNQDDWNTQMSNLKLKENGTISDGYLIRKNQTKFPVEMIHSIRRVMEKDYQLTLFRDVTEKIKQEKEKEEMKLQLFSSAKLSHLGEMATHIAHEINNPLTVIVGKNLSMKKMLNVNEIDSTKFLDAIEKVDETVNRIAKVIRSLRNITKSLDDDSFCSEYLLEIIEDIEFLFSGRAKAQLLNFKIMGKENILNTQIYCNRSQIAQLLMNLINNAFEAIQNLKDQSIVVELSEIKGMVTIKVIDSGKGISPDKLANIFEPFFTTKNMGEGRGLGLSIAENIAARHNGKLYYDKMERNTTFIFELPSFTK